MTKEKIKREIEDLKTKISVFNQDCPYLKIDLDYVKRCLENDLTKEEKEFNDKIESMTAEEFYNYVKPLMDEYKRLLTG